MVAIGMIQVSGIAGLEVAMVVEKFLLVKLMNMKWLFVIDSWVNEEQKK